MPWYALRDGDRWWFHFGSLGKGVPHIASEPLTAGERGWWSAPAALVGEDPNGLLIETERPARRVVSRYLRALEALEYPGELSVAEYEARTDDESDLFDRRVEAIFEPEWEEQLATRAPLPGEWIVLEGAPAPADGRKWTAQLPYELRTHSEYLHLFPGWLEGYREAAAAALNDVPGVQVHTHSGPLLSVWLNVEVPKRPPHPWDHHEPPARKKRRALQKDTTTRVTRHLDVRVADRVAGENRAAAAYDWDVQLAELVAAITRMVACVCPTCQGHGYVESIPKEES